MRNSIPDILIEQAALGELSEAEMEKLRSECDLEARIAELEASNDEILAAYPPEEMAAKIRKRAAAHEAGPRIIEGVFKAVLPLAAAAALFVTLGMPLLQDRAMPAFDPNNAAGIRLKGMKPHFQIYRQSGSEAEPLADQDLARENDLLQLSYVAGGADYGVLLSIDGRGAVTLHYPDSPFGDQRLAAEGEYALPFSYQLDDAPSFERFYFIAGDEEIPMELVMEEAERVAMSRTGKWVESFQIPEEYTQQSILLLKE